MLLNFPDSEKTASKIKFLWIMFLFCCYILIHSVFFFEASFWDEVVYYQNLEFLVRENLNPFSGQWCAKLPFFRYLAYLFSHLGHSFAGIRLLVSVFSFVSITYIYRLGEHLFDKETAFWSAFLLLSFPMFFIHSHLFHYAVPFACLFWGALYYRAAGKMRAYALCGSLMCFTREFGIVVAGLMLVFDVFIYIRAKCLKTMRTERNVVFADLIPISLYITWRILFFVNTGTAFSKQKYLFADYFSIDLLSFYNVAESMFFWNPIRIFIFTVVLIGVIAGFFNKKIGKIFFRNDFACLVFLTIGFFCLFSSFSGAFRHRYALFLIVPFLIYFAAFIRAIVKGKVQIFAFSFLLVLFVLSGFNSDFQGTRETSFDYLRIIDSHKQILKYIEKENFALPLFLEWPHYYYASNPVYGYVNGALDNIQDALWLAPDNYDPESIRSDKVLFLHDTVSGAPDAMQLNRILGKYPVVKRFVYPRGEAVIYEMSKYDVIEVLRNTN